MFYIVVRQGSGVCRIISELLKSTFGSTFKKVEPCANCTGPEPLLAVFEKGHYLIARNSAGAAVCYKSFKSIGFPVQQVQADISARPDVVPAIAVYGIDHIVAQAVWLVRIMRKVYRSFFVRVKKIEAIYRSQPDFAVFIRSNVHDIIAADALPVGAVVQKGVKFICFSVVFIQAAFLGSDP